jgi:alpha-galactosidase/6-phospho-beta-glucosidase family protein
MKLTLVGTGVRTPIVLHGLAARQGELGLTEVVLHDVDAGRLEVMSALGMHLARSWGASFSVRGEIDASEALAGARFVFAAIRAGGDDARALDERIALGHGVLGQETTGAAGFAMAMRTIPEILRLADLIARVAPEAVLVNFTNPVGLILQALTDHASVPAVGVCDGPFGMERDVRRLLGPGDDLHIGYLGLNHCGWIHRVESAGRDRMPEVLDRYSELQAIDHSWRMFDPGLVRGLGMLPMEYLYFYYYRDRAVEHILASGGSRGEQIAAINAPLWPELSSRVRAGDLAGAHDAWSRAMDERSATYFARERGEGFEDAPPDNTSEETFEPDGYEGVALGVMTAIAGGQETPLVLNTPNRGAIEGLEDDAVVEVSCLVDGAGAHPLPQGQMPEAAAALVEPVKAYERLTVRAAVEGSYDTALRALLAHPLVGSYPIAKALLDDFVSAHDGFLSGVRPGLRNPVD